MDHHLFERREVQSAADYKQENDAARITAKPEPNPITIETFTIGVADVKGASATLNFLWDKTRVPVKLTTGDVEQVTKQLDAVVSATISSRSAHRLSGRGFLLRQRQGHEPGSEMDRPSAGEEPGCLLHALQKGADSGEAWQQERRHNRGAKGDRHFEERQSAG